MPFSFLRHQLRAEVRDMDDFCCKVQLLSAENFSAVREHCPPKNSSPPSESNNSEIGFFAPQNFQDLFNHN